MYDKACCYAATQLTLLSSNQNRMGGKLFGSQGMLRRKQKTSLLFLMTHWQLKIGGFFLNILKSWLLWRRQQLGWKAELFRVIVQFLLNSIADNSIFLGNAVPSGKSSQPLNGFLARSRSLRNGISTMRCLIFTMVFSLDGKVRRVLLAHRWFTCIYDMSLPFVFTLDTSGNGLRRNGRTGRIRLRLLNWAWKICGRSIKEWK